MNRPAKIVSALTGTTAVLLSAALAAPSGAVAGPPDTPAPGAAGSIPKNLTPVDQIPAEDVGARIAAVADAGYSEAYGGTQWDAKSKTLYVNVAAPRGKQADRRAAFRDAVTNRERAAKSPVKVVFRPVPLSVAGQQAFLRTFMADRASWGGPSAVRNVVSAVVDETTGHLTADVTDDLAALRQAAHRRFGHTVSLRSGKPIELYNRYYDTAPWTAGNALWDTQNPDDRYSASCTQGFSWRRWSDNARYASTAGHCYEPQQNVFNGVTSQRLGYVGTKYLNNGEYVDFEYIRITYGSVDNSVWVGAVPNAQERRVVTADNDGTQTNFQVCSSGANAGLACGTIVNRTTAFTYRGYPGEPTLYNLTCVSALAGRGFPVRGDSGGPVLSTASDGSVKAWGQLVGGKDCNGDGATDWVFATVKNIALRAGASIIAS